MKIDVVAFNGSAHKNGNTALLLEVLCGILQLRGFSTEIISLCELNIQPCRGCFACKEALACSLQDDFAPCLAKMCDAKAIILGSPVYSADVSARMKIFCERAGVIAAQHQGLLKHKVGASVAAVRRAGGLAAVDTMNHFLLNKEVLVVGSSYWNMVYGKTPGEVLNDAEGMRNMRNLGENMAWTLEKLYGAADRENS